MNPENKIIQIFLDSQRNDFDKSFDRLLREFCVLSSFQFSDNFVKHGKKADLAFWHDGQPTWLWLKIPPKIDSFDFFNTFHLLMGGDGCIVSSTDGMAIAVRNQKIIFDSYFNAPCDVLDLLLTFFKKEADKNE